MYVLYSALLAFLLLITLPYWLLQMLRHGKYRAGLRQRLGAVPRHLREHGEHPREQPTIWVHAVSVGEVVASSAVVEALRRGIPGTSRVGFNHHQHRTEAGGKKVRRGERFFLSAGFRVCGAALH